VQRRERRQLLQLVEALTRHALRQRVALRGPELQGLEARLRGGVGHVKLRAHGPPEVRVAQQLLHAALVLLGQAAARGDWRGRGRRELRVAREIGHRCCAEEGRAVEGGGAAWSCHTARCC
jgi:hypothetical protein